VERIAIIGCGGSGKSHLARHLGERHEEPAGRGVSPEGLTRSAPRTIGLARARMFW
jgi:ABC-type phosphate/phosphonate transport system ATPase subunit